MSRGILLLFLSGIILRLIYLFLTPLGQVPDEPYHFERIYATAVNMRFPQAIVSHKIDYQNSTYPSPPLFYLAYAVLLVPFLHEPLPPTLTAFVQYGLYLRFVSFFLSLVTIILVARFTRSLYPKLLSLFLCILLLFPQWTASSSWVGSDPLFLLLVTLTLIKSVSLLTRPYTIKSGVLLGIFVGVSLLAKPLGPMLFGGIEIAILTAKAWQGKRIRALIMFTLTVSLVTGWWYINNYLTTGSFTAAPFVQAVVTGYTKPFSFPFYPLALLYFTSATFIGAFGPTNNIHFPVTVYLITSLTILFLFFKAWKNRLQLMQNAKHGVLISILLTMTCFAFLQFFIINTTLSFQPQGRYLYPLFFLFPIIIASALSHKKSTMIVSLVSCILIGINLWGIHCISSWYYKLSFFPLHAGCEYDRVNLPPWEEPLKLQ